MLAKRYRLRRSSEFDRVREQGKCWSDRRLVLCACQNGLGWPRFGIVASKRIGNAVVRNRVRRLISEAVRVQCDLVRPGWDVVLIARRGILGADYWAVEGSVTQLLGTAKLFDATLGKSSVALEEGQ